MQPAAQGRSRSLVIRPSFGAYFNKWVRNIALPVVAITLVVIVYRSVTTPGAANTFMVAVVAVALFGFAFFSRAEIAVADGALTYRRFLWRRRFPLEAVGGLALRSLDLRWNYNARGPTPYAVIYGSNRRALFSFSAAFWRDHDLLRLRHAIGGDNSKEPLRPSELQAEFPGALPGWFLFYEAHPFWTIAIGSTLMLAAIIAGIVLWDAIKGR